MSGLIEPVWPYADRIRIFTTTRSGGVSRPPFDSFNLGDHVGDSPGSVLENRRRLSSLLGDRSVHWMNQVHGTDVVRASGQPTDSRGAPRADGIWTSETGLALGVLTADCLPVVLVNESFSACAVAHGGWRGLVGGVLAATLEALPGSGHIAWIGPGIGPDAYEVGEEVIEAVRQSGVASDGAIIPGPGKSHLDLFSLAERQLAALGVDEVYCERICTHRSSDLYSYRRDGETGRMATMAYLLERSG